LISDIGESGKSSPFSFSSGMIGDTTLDSILGADYSQNHLGFYWDGDLDDAMGSA